MERAHAIIRQNPIGRQTQPQNLAQNLFLRDFFLLLRLNAKTVWPGFSSIYNDFERGFSFRAKKYK